MPREPKKKSYELTDVLISFVSLVGKAANKRKFLVTKGNDGTAAVQSYGAILKADSDTHYITGIVYEPMSADTDDEFMTAEEIEKAEKYFTSNDGQIDLQHNFKPCNGLSVVASWIQKCDCNIAGSDIKAGTWLMTVKCENSEVWDKVKKGEFGGFSMGGTANVSSIDVNIDKEETEEPKLSLFQKLAKSFGYNLVKVDQSSDDEEDTKQDGEEDDEKEDNSEPKDDQDEEEEVEMKESELKKMMDENNESIIKSVKDIITEAFAEKPVEKEEKELTKKDILAILKENNETIIKSVKEEIDAFQSKRGFAKNINGDDDDKDIKKEENECFLHGYL